jgi:hypothetical protein
MSLSIIEVLKLERHDGVHGVVHRVLALLDGIDKPFGRVYFLLNKLNGIPVSFIFPIGFGVGS